MSNQRWDVMTVVEYQSQGQTKNKWTKIGAAFTNQDGSIGIQLDALPLDGRLILQIPLSREEREARYQARQQGGGGGQNAGGNRWGSRGGGAPPQQGGQRGGGRGFGGGRPQQTSFQQGQASYQPEPNQNQGDAYEGSDDDGGVPFG